MTTAARILGAAAAVAVVGITAINLAPKPGIGPAAVPSVPVSVVPSSAAPVATTTLQPSAGSNDLPQSGPLAQRTYVIGDPFQLSVLLKVPSDRWFVWAGPSAAGGALYLMTPDPPAGAGVIVTVVDQVYRDACSSGADPFDPGPGTDDLARALAAQPRTTSIPIANVSLAGHDGTYVEYRLDGQPTAGCAELTRWLSGGPRQAVSTERDRVWILDVAGTRLVIDAFSFADTTVPDLAEVQEVIDSITIEP